MKTLLVSTLIGFTTMTLLTGCIASGGKTVREIHYPTVGQQLMDLQKAKEAGAITEPEYEAEKARILRKQ